MHNPFLHPAKMFLRTYTQVVSWSTQCAEMLSSKNCSMSLIVCCICLRSRLLVAASRETQLFVRILLRWFRYQGALRRLRHSMSSHYDSHSSQDKNSHHSAPHIHPSSIMLTFRRRMSSCLDLQRLVLSLLDLVILSPCTKLQLHSNKSVYHVHFRLDKTLYFQVTHFDTI